MGKKKYKDFNFRAATMKIILMAEQILDEYEAQGYDLTLRQLYYKFIARDLFPEDRRWSWTGSRWKRDPNGTKNADPNYKWLGATVNNARLAGCIDWNQIVDRTRETESNSHWSGPKSIIRSCASQFALDTRETQDIYVEVWVEKDALIGIVGKICEELDVTYLSCRGFVSQSAMWQASLRLIEQEQDGKETTIIQLSDLDPSGIDMTRDIQDRLVMFGSDVEVERIALNMNQIEQYNPPPSPAKITDSRYNTFVEEYGEDSWELDALEPAVITELIRENVNKQTDEEARELIEEKQARHRFELGQIAQNYNAIVKKFKSE